MYLSVTPQRVLPRSLAFGLLVGLYAVLVGLRDPFVGSDTPTYVDLMLQLGELRFVEVLRRFLYAPSYLFWYGSWASAKLGLSPALYLLLLASASIGIYARGLWLLAGQDKRQALLMWAVVLASVSTHLAFGNVLRQGAALAFAAIAVAKAVNGQGSRGVMVAVVGILLHRSMIVVVLVLVVAQYKRLSIRWLKWIALTAPFVSPLLVSALAEWQIPVISDRVRLYSAWSSSWYAYARIAAVWLVVPAYHSLLRASRNCGPHHWQLYRLFLLFSAAVFLASVIPEIATRLLIYLPLFHASFLSCFVVGARYRGIYLGLGLPVAAVAIVFASFYPGIQANFSYSL